MNPTKIHKEIAQLPKILVPIDFSDEPVKAYYHTYLFAKEFSCPIETKIQEVGSVTKQMLEISEKASADLVVMGTHGKKGLHLKKKIR